MKYWWEYWDKIYCSLLVGLVIILLIVTACSLQGCGWKSVLMPVAVECPVPPALVRPVWPIATLNGTETIGEQIRAWAGSLQAERGYSMELELLLNGYRK
jgi:hypothetical protein